MPPLAPAPGTIKVQLVWQIGTDASCMNVLHYGYGGTPPLAGDCAAIGNKMAGAFLGTQQALFPTSTTLNTIIVQDIASQTGAQAQVTVGKAGTDVRAACPQFNATVMAFIIGRKYRGGHPRAYFPPMTTGVMADALHWTGAAIGAFSNAMNPFLSSLNGFLSGGCTVNGQTAIQYHSGHTWSAPDHLGNPHKIPTPVVPPVAWPVLSTATRAVIGSVRRRKGL